MPELILFILLLIVTGVAMIVRYVRLPYTVALVLMGLALAMFNWELLAYIVTSVLFLLLGLRIHISDLLSNLLLILVAVAAIPVSRAIVVYSIGRWSQRFTWKIPRAFSHIMYWGGLRGAISIALALSVTGPFAAQIQVMTFGVVLFTLLVQGLTIKGLINRLGVGGHG